MLPDAFFVQFVFLGESVAAFSVYQTLSLATIIDDHHPQLGINLAFTVPVAAGGANFHFGGEDQFWAHNWQLVKFSHN